MSSKGAVVEIAIVGAGIFVKTEYIPALAGISHLVAVKAIWSRSQESARAAVDIARRFFPHVECKWGDEGLDHIIHDSSIPAVAVALAGQVQVEISLKLLKGGKHVLQEKPASASVSEAETALSRYASICTSLPVQPIWAVAENFRFEPVFVEGKKLISEIGDMMSVQVIVEGSMTSSNPYFTSSWRRNFTGGFILDMGVHFIGALRMLVGCEIVLVSALTSHSDLALPPPDNISCVFQMENGCSGVFVIVVSSRSPKIFWRVVGLKGTLQIETVKDGFLVSLFGVDGQSKSTLFPFNGVTEELKAFINDVSQATQKEAGPCEAEPRSSYIEGARDVAVLDAMLESGTKKGTPVQVKLF